MIKTSRQLKDMIRNLSKEKAADAQILMRNYMMERFLERVSMSVYKDKFILKGGMLVAAMVGLDARSTMDMDATIKDAPVNIDKTTNIMKDIISIYIDDGVKFQINRVSEIMDVAEYPGVRVSMVALFDGITTPLKIDISTGDAVIPKEIRYSFRMMFEERSINIWAYNLETIMAEKLETIIVRTITNTRIRDFYDIFILMKLYGGDLNFVDLHKALIATAVKRNSEKLLSDAESVFNEVENNSVMQKLWKDYCKKFNYAEGIEWSEVMDSVKKLYAISGRT